MSILYPYVDQDVVKVRYLQRTIKEHYSLNIYGSDLVRNIMANFKLFSKSAVSAFVVNNNLPVHTMETVPIIFSREKENIGCQQNFCQPPKINIQFDTEVKVEQGLREALEHIVEDIKEYNQSCNLVTSLRTRRKKSRK